MFDEHLEKFLGSGYAHLIIVLGCKSSSWNALQAHLKRKRNVFSWLRACARSHSLSMCLISRRALLCSNRETLIGELKRKNSGETAEKTVPQLGAYFRRRKVLVCIDLKPRQLVTIVYHLLPRVGQGLHIFG